MQNVSYTHHLRNILLRLNPSNLNQAITTLRHSLRNRIRSLALSLCPNDTRLPLLLRLLDNESRPLSILLRNLLVLDGLRELPSEGHVGDGDVFELDVEFAGAFEKVGADAVGDGFTLGDEFGGIELGDDGFEDFVADGGEDALVVVLAKVL